MPTPTPASATPSAIAETSPAHPDVSVEPLGDDTYRVTVADPAAKAWRVTVRGEQELSDASLRVTVETSDVQYAIDVARSSATGGRTDIPLPGPNRDPICESTIHACLAPDGVRTPPRTSAHSTRFVITVDPGMPVEIVAGVAGWSAEPFVLGPWHDAEPLALGG